MNALRSLPFPFPSSLLMALDEQSKAAHALGMSDLAYTSARRAMTIDDTLRSREALTQMRYMELKELQQENASLLDINAMKQKMNEDAQARIVLQRWLIAGSIVLILLAIAMLIMGYQSYQRRKKSEQDLLQLGIHQLESRAVEVKDVDVHATVERVFLPLANLAEAKGNRLKNEVPKRIEVLGRP